MHLVLFSNKQVVQLDHSVICENLNLTIDKYLDAYNELLDNDYLVPAANREPTLYFRDYPLVRPYLTGLDDEVEGKEEDEW